MDIRQAIEYFYNKMELGLIENDTQQEVYELAIKALERQTPRKPIPIQESFMHTYYKCPNCNDVVLESNNFCNGHRDAYNKDRDKDGCGQLLDWGND